MNYVHKIFVGNWFLGLGFCKRRRFSSYYYYFISLFQVFIDITFFAMGFCALIECFHFLQKISGGKQILITWFSADIKSDYLHIDHFFRKILCLVIILSLTKQNKILNTNCNFLRLGVHLLDELIVLLLTILSFRQTFFPLLSQRTYSSEAFYKNVTKSPSLSCDMFKRIPLMRRLLQTVDKFTKRRKPEGQNHPNTNLFLKAANSDEKITEIHLRQFQGKQ